MKNNLHCVQTLQMDFKILSSSRKRSYKGFYLRFNTKPAANHAPTTDLMYCNTYWLIAKKEADKANEILMKMIISILFQILKWCILLENT